VRPIVLTLLLALPGMAAEPEYPSPGGQYVLRVASDEVKMSHWVDVTYLCCAGEKQAGPIVPVLGISSTGSWKKQ